MLFLLLAAPGAAGTALEGEVESDDELLNARGFNISTNDFRLLLDEGGAPAF